MFLLGYTKYDTIPRSSSPTHHHHIQLSQIPTASISTLCASLLLLLTAPILPIRTLRIRINKLALLIAAAPSPTLPAENHAVVHLRIGPVGVEEGADVDYFFGVRFRDGDGDGVRVGVGFCVGCGYGFCACVNGVRWDGRGLSIYVMGWTGTD